MKFDPMPSECNNCGGKRVIYGRMTEFGIKAYQSGYCYYCLDCGAYVGTHMNRPKEALGILSDSKTRKLRVTCHKEIDKHWYSSAGKNRAYYRLSQEMGMKSENCHFGYMDYEQLVEALHIMKKWGDYNAK